MVTCQKPLQKEEVKKIANDLPMPIQFNKYTRHKSLLENNLRVETKKCLIFVQRMGPKENGTKTCPVVSRLFSSVSASTKPK